MTQLGGKGALRSNDRKIQNTAPKPSTRAKICDQQQTDEISGLARKVKATCGDSEKEKSVDVVKVAKIQHVRNGKSHDVTPTLYVFPGEMVTFKAIKSPLQASWPAGKPVWGGRAMGTGPNTNVTFAAADNNKTITAECGNTMTVNIKVSPLVATFSAAEVRPGTRQFRHATVTVTVRRAAAGNEESITLLPDNATATVSPDRITLGANETEKSVEVNIMGSKLSTDNQDTNLNAWSDSAGTIIGSMPVTVVEPTKYCIESSVTSTHPWRLHTTAFLNFPADAGKVTYSIPVEITVIDQFDEVLTKPFEGARVQERVKNQGQADFDELGGLDLADLPNQFSNLSASGTVNDVLRNFLPLGSDAQAVVNATQPVPVKPAKVYPRDFVNLPGVTDPFVESVELRFFVDGQELQGRTSRVRTVTNNVETVTNTVVGGK